MMLSRNTGIKLVWLMQEMKKKREDECQVM